MPKTKKKNTEEKKEKVEKASFLDKINNNQKSLAALIIVLIPLLYFFLPWEMNNLRPTGNDVQSIIGQTHKWTEYRDATGETVLWNPNIFMGEPIYSRLTPKLLHIDSLLYYFNKYIFYWVFWYMLLGGIGIFFLLRYKAIPWYIAIIVAVAFVLLPDWYAQIGEGHNSKLRAIMTLPWVFLSFSYLFDKKSWLSAGLFAFAFSWLVRTHHFQIVFYGIMVLFFIYIWPTIKILLDKKYKDLASLAIKFIVALTLTFLTTAQPLFTTNEYAEYSTRGGNPVKLGEDAKTAEAGGGVSFDYATQWSFSPNEIMDWFIPRFSGGVQGEIYDGDKFPRLAGQQVPGYWGDKPFNGNYAFVGMILFMFAIIGSVHYRKDKFVMALSIFVAFSVLLSFGRHLPELYKLLFYYLPYFSKFRAPAMIVNITFIVVLILSGYGLKAVVHEITAKDYKWVIGIFGTGILITVAILMMSDTFAYATARDAQQYNAQTLGMIKEIRQEFLIADTQKLLIFILLATGVVVAFLFRKIKKEVFIILILLLSAFELFSVSNRAYKAMNLQNRDQLEQTIYRDTDITKVLKADKSNKRAIVIGRGLTDNHYAYFYPLISGYSAIKLQKIQDVIEHNLFKGQSASGINWNVINMMSGKFVISPQQLPNPNLKLVATDQARQETLYENTAAFEKAWFVKNIKSFDTPEDLVLYMNKAEFNPADTVLMVKAPAELQTDYTQQGNIQLVNYTPNKVEFEVSVNEDQFLAIAEMYYEKGWHAYLDGEETPVYQVNHVLRGVPVKANTKKLVLEFMPSTYYASLYTLWIGNIIILGLIGFGFIRMKKQINA